MRGMTTPEPQKAPESRSDCYLVFSANGSICKAHVGPEAEFTSANHASVINGFTVKGLVHEDFREYKG
jgi:hypothetical protein